MSGDTLNTHIWANADVYIGPIDATPPTDVDTPFGGEWDLVGLLDGDDGFVYTHENDKSDHFAWGGVLVRTSRAHDKFTVKFSAVEKNAVTDALRWPGSADGSLVIPRPEQVMIAFETTDGDAVHRLISAAYAEVDLDGDVTENETDLAKLQFIATIFPDTTGDFPYPLFAEQSSASGS